MSQFALLCPACGTRLQQIGPGCMICPIDGGEYTRIDGVWRLLKPDRVRFFDQFVQDYETVRRKEGRGAANDEWYRVLPFEDRSGRFSYDWRIRARSYRALLNQVIVPLEDVRTPHLKVGDLGAGNCWLSNRLAERGHRVAAVDLLTNEFDGLGAHIHYTTEFTPVQAEFDCLPFSDGEFDLTVFNGSLHYSIDYQTTLAEALRVLHPGGRLVIMDSPIYQCAESGEQMVREREEHFERKYGFRSNSLPSENFLTYGRLNTLAGELAVRWRIIKPYYGWRWTLRPLRAKLRGHREPARFHVIVGEVSVND